MEKTGRSGCHAGRRFGLLFVASIALVVLELKRRNVAVAFRESKRQFETAAAKLAEVEAQYRAVYPVAKTAEALAAKLAESETRCQGLARYQGVLDAESTARSMLKEASERVSALAIESRANADSILAEARARLEATAAEAVSLRANAAATADELREQGRASLEEARTNAAAILDKAKQEAEEAAREASRLEKTAHAMKTVIEGYPLASRRKIELRGFGTFQIRHYKQHVGRNPRSGATVEVRPKRLPHFKVSKELAARVDKGRGK